MPRLLLFLVVGLAAFLLFRTCGRPEPVGPGVRRVEGVAAPDEGALLALQSSDGATRVLLAPDGSVAQIVVGGTRLLRPVPVSRRPLALLVRYADGGVRSLSRETWKAEASDGGYRFELAHEGATLRKTVRLSDDARALVVSVEARGAPPSVAGFEMPGPSGVRLGERLDRAGVFLRLPGGLDPSYESWEAIAARQEARRSQENEKRARGEAAQDPPYPTKYALSGALPLAGALGESAYVAFADLEGARAVSVEAYLAAREEGETAEIEMWATLDLEGGSCNAAFRLAFGDAERLRAEEPAIFRDAAFARADETLHVLENGTVRYEFTDRGAVAAAFLKRFTVVAGRPPSEDTWIPVLRAEVPAAQRALTLDAPRDVERIGADLARDPWAVERIPGGLRFRLATRKGWTFEKRVTLPEEGRYALRVAISIEAPPGERTLTYRLVGPSGVYIEDVHRGITATEPERILRLERSGGEDDRATLEQILERAERMDRRYPGPSERGLFHAFAIRGAYFVGALATEERRQGDRLAGNVVAAHAEAVTLTRDVTRPDGTRTRRSMLGRVTCEMALATGGAEDRYILYAGPNALEHLRPVELEETVDFGTFGFIGRFLMWIMKVFQGLTGSYGVAIILMTMVVRALLLPISYRTQLSMQRYAKRVQKIKPLLDEIQKKYAQNPQRMNQERMRVMREHKVGFPAGCLTILLQIPIWFALFQGLRVEFSLRHQPFLWAEDLAMPDRLLALAFWPHWFNLLPILMLVLWVWQQRATPTPASDDPQVQAQMKMMRLMPYVFFLFLYNYAAALSVYMCVSSLWGIVEGKLVRRAMARVE
jgi:YidC/Oxa1 family membrane protein insertase